MKVNWSPNPTRSEVPSPLTSVTTRGLSGLPQPCVQLKSVSAVAEGIGALGPGGGGGGSGGAAVWVIVKLSVARKVDIGSCLFCWTIRRKVSLPLVSLLSIIGTET